MPDTGEKGEIISRVNAREKETMQELKKLVSKTRAEQSKEHSAKQGAKRRK